ncbi:MAG: RNA methyltransferase [Oscillospiraceae bacterium]|nr:RNA methyltransferase [Oscillospiraceae bacterium]
MQTEIITSRQNPKIARFRALMNNRKARLDSGEFAVEGGKLFHEAVNSGLKPLHLLISEKFSEKNNNFCKTASNLCNIDIISTDLAEYISDTKSPQGVFFTLSVKSLLDKFSKLTTIINDTANKSRLIILDGVQDPGNVGAIIRSCDAFGIAGLILSETCADITSPKVIRSAMGSVFRLPVVREDLTQIITLLKEKGYMVAGADLNENAKNLKDFAFPGKCAVVIGSEGAGISGEVKSLCDDLIYIPIQNAESLNAAVAASVIIYELQKM